MKPIKLSMKAFLGFKEKCEIDFERLYEDRIFLITGATGAGKTSIFDGICYALYGEASGNERDKANCYRCHLSPDTEEMEVTLSFSVKGTVYHVRRVENAKGVKKIHFYREDDAEHVMTKIKEANAEIADVLGLTLEQFKKIVMIPQGEFREFLAAGTQEKSDILKKLFSTEIYQKMQDLIKVRYDQSKSLHRSHIDRFAEIMKDCGLEGEDIEKGNDLLAMKLEEARSHQSACAERVKLRETELKNAELEAAAAKENNRSFEEYGRVREAYFTLLGKETSFQEKREALRLIRLAEAISPKETEACRKQEELQRVLLEREGIGKAKKGLEVRRQALQRTLEEILPDYTSLDIRKLERNGLSNLLEKAGRVRDLTQKLEQTNAEADRLQDRIAGYQKAEALLERLGVEEGEKRDGLFRLQLEGSALQKDKADLEGRRQVLLTAYKRNDAREKLEKKIADNKAALALLEEVLGKRTEAYRVANEARNENYSMILRTELMSGEPCPVCGSLDHPVTATADVKMRDDGFAAAEEALARARKDHTTKEAELSGDERNLREIIEEISAFSAENGVETMEVSAIRMMGNEVKERIASLLVKSAQVISQAEGLKGELDRMRTQQDEIRTSLQDAGEARAALEDVKDARVRLEAEIRTLQEEGAVWDERELKRQIQSLDDFIRETASRHEETNRAYQEVLREDSLLQGKEATLQARQTALETEAESLAAIFNGHLQDAGFTQEVYTNLKKRIPGVPVMEKEIADHADALSSRRGAYEHLKAKGDTLVFIEPLPLEEKVGRFREELEVGQRAHDEGKIICHHLERAMERTSGLLLDYAKNRETFSMLQKLNTTASVGMSFETFVQSWYFEGILLRANERLRKMTDSRFQLRRRSDTESRREKRGLDLNIYDAHSGRERNVLSLSGGESFKASLSLALGLSDFIESSRGSVNLETIFIDEGFGSLDQDSLENALGCLMDLNLSGRIVGIISHVSELKDRIPRKINVRSVPGKGSVAEIN